MEAEVHHGRRREDGVESGAQRRQRLAARAMSRGPQVALADDVIVGVVAARPQLPAVGPALGQDRIGEAFLARRIRETRHAHPERTLLPGQRLAGFLLHVGLDVPPVHACELPVGNSRAELQCFRARRQLCAEAGRAGAGQQHGQDGVRTGGAHGRVRGSAGGRDDA